MKQHVVEKGISISLIIPAKNEEAYLRACLDSVAQQTLHPIEIIVVDNGSTDNTADIVKSYDGVVYIHEPRPGLPQARQAGLDASTGSWLVYIDADSRLPKDYLEQIVNALDGQADVVAVSNPSRFYDGTRVLDVFIRLFFFNFSVLARLGLVRFIFGGSFAIRRTALVDLGGFNTDIHFYGEDTDLTRRMQDVGRIVYVPDAWNSTSARRYKELGFWKTIWYYASVYMRMSVFDMVHSFFFADRSFVIRRVFAAFAIVVSTITFYGFFSPASQVFGKTERTLPLQEISEKTVALTFDDGPNGTYTEQVLDILEREQIHATFFLIGKNAEAYPDIVKRIASDGDVIGNHSYSHSFFLPFYQEKKAEQELALTNTIITDETGVTPTLFRPPHGWKTPHLLHAARKEGLTVVTWNDMTIDYVAYVKSGKIAKEILEGVKPGSIIVLHDGLNLLSDIDRRQTIDALEVIIKTLKEEGYSFVTL
ncbi:MAG: hypothetical protein COU32_03020 [Candidatus Magasanikbacteria bacterium CG10_big_fil_rev_8_21_14_0_10_42_10]|uniref:NodB homology domain-containing protein n=2 Tax=Candidatus Magasanikiibacteriota TaxID=1752731 RepID=A0A2H0TXT9_9BACT|nr:MAG: hypothetical protein COU32_03020 [Candidatus Magasanikbacteria bacterium CG10_big_fil_rev_8_21_14_0_10_42_10]PIZ93230.1 MAG: hypothetical protein COX82_03250 [Candidatus Magasanikbacteria bacterium CG_4_10_14_0_2_um_filter_41_10]